MPGICALISASISGAVLPVAWRKVAAGFSESGDAAFLLQVRGGKEIAGMTARNCQIIYRLQPRDENLRLGPYQNNYLGCTLPMVGTGFNTVNLGRSFPHRIR